MESRRAEWDRLLAGSPPGGRAAAFTDLIARYGQPHRRYHTVAHLGSVLDALDALDAVGEPGAGPAVRLAAWYHDAVYDPTAPPGDNESRSATLARETLAALAVDPAIVFEVVRLVELTGDHTVAPGDAAGAVLVDADLSILGAEPAAYDRYAAGVRAEYAHVAADGWRAGRAAVLRSFLGRPAIFQTAAGRERWEAAARANLARELAALTPAPAG
jgi:predicted metal-dependent HD superfamily phosphohydrolase